VRGLRSFAETHTEIGTDAKESATQKIILLANIIGILEKDTYKEKLPGNAHELIKKRETLRATQHYKEADEIRTQLKKEHGIILEDTEYGPVWYK